MNDSFTSADFLSALVPYIVTELRPPAEIKKFTTNPALIGGYNEWPGLTHR